MHWTDPFNDTNKSAPQYAEAGLQLIRLLRAEGWKPEDIGAFASPLAAEIRNALKLTFQHRRTV